MPAAAAEVEINFSPLAHRYSDQLKNIMGKKRTSADIVFEYLSEKQRGL